MCWHRATFFNVVVPIDFDRINHQKVQRTHISIGSIAKAHLPRGRADDDETTRPTTRDR
jgi:hypothetical protein